MAQIVTLEAQRQADNAARQRLEPGLRAAHVTGEQATDAWIWSPARSAGPGSRSGSRTAASTGRNAAQTAARGDVGLEGLHLDHVCPVQPSIRAASGCTFRSLQKGHEPAPLPGMTNRTSAEPNRPGQARWPRMACSFFADLSPITPSTVSTPGRSGFRGWGCVIALFHGNARHISTGGRSRGRPRSRAPRSYPMRHRMRSRVRQSWPAQSGRSPHTWPCGRGVRAARRPFGATSASRPSSS
jgi:hypothetical protein